MAQALSRFPKFMNRSPVARKSNTTRLLSRS
ncbi:Uncharacterised protein [Vibrio cholerae]|nr:Uncharacterised protein [Vibrio cholerae]CSI84882.1 Uncharacterised protein [Vibrio cholerae]